MTSSTPDPTDLFLINRGNTSYKIPYSDLSNSLLANLSDGQQGDIGPIGPAGGLGATGATGLQGVTGPKGDGFTVVGVTAQTDNPFNEDDNSSAIPNTGTIDINGYPSGSDNPNANPPPSGLSYTDENDNLITRPAIGMCYVQPENQHLWMYSETRDGAGLFVSGVFKVSKAHREKLVLLVPQVQPVLFLIIMT